MGNITMNQGNIHQIRVNLPEVDWETTLHMDEKRTLYSDISKYMRTVPGWTAWQTEYWAARSQQLWHPNNPKELQELRQEARGLSVFEDVPLLATATEHLWQRWTIQWWTPKCCVYSIVESVHMYDDSVWYSDTKNVGLLPLHLSGHNRSHPFVRQSIVWRIHLVLWMALPWWWNHSSTQQMDLHCHRCGTTLTGTTAFSKMSLQMSWRSQRLLLSLGNHIATS